MSIYHTFHLFRCHLSTLEELLTIKQTTSDVQETARQLVTGCSTDVNLHSPQNKESAEQLSLTKQSIALDLWMCG